MNPPFSKAHFVIEKISLENAKAVLALPDWQGMSWGKRLEEITVAKSEPLEGSIYFSESSKRMPAPKWRTIIRFVDGSKASILPEDKTRKWIRRVNQGWSLEELHRQCELPFPCEHEAETEYPRKKEAVLEEDEFNTSKISFGTDEEWNLEDLVGHLDLEHQMVLSQIAEPKELEKFPDTVKFQGTKQVSKSGRHFEGQEQRRFLEYCLGMKMGLEEKMRDDPASDEIVREKPEIPEWIWKENQVVFEDLPKIDSKTPRKFELDFELRDDCKSRTLRSKAYPCSLQDEEFFEQQISELLKKGMLERVNTNEVPPFSSPAFIVHSNGKRRLVVDYSKLNPLIKIHAGSLPSMDRCISKLVACRYKSVIDLRSGFWQVKLSKRASNLTTFVVPSGELLRWRVLPFGLHLAPAAFQACMAEVVGEVKSDPRYQNLRNTSSRISLEAFVDDAGLGAMTEDDARTLVNIFLSVLERNFLRAIGSKCQWVLETVTYLGHELSWANGTGLMKPTSSKIEAIKDLTISSKAEVRRVLGVANFYRRYIRNFSIITFPLTELLKKNSKFEWSEECETALRKIKRGLEVATGLGSPTPEGIFVIMTDASSSGGGGAIYQVQDPVKIEDLQVREGVVQANGQDSKLIPIGFFSWKHNQARRNYSVYDLELLSGVLIFTSQSWLLRGSKCLWLTDQRSITEFFKATPPLEPRRCRWWTFLKQFSIRILYIKGVHNFVADFLSRKDFERKTGVDVEAEARKAIEEFESHISQEDKIFFHECATSKELTK